MYREKGLDVKENITQTIQITLLSKQTTLMWFRKKLYEVTKEV